MFGFKQKLEALAMGRNEFFGADDAGIGKIARAIPEAAWPADLKIVPALFFKDLFIDYQQARCTGPGRGLLLLALRQFI